MEQAAKARAFRALHVKGDPLVLFNIWDAGSAVAVAAAGARALATGSWSVAAAHGFADGEGVPLAFALDNLRRITAATDLPVSLDFERGYGRDAAEVERSAAQAVEAGAIGVNIEDSLDGALRPIAEQAERIAAVRRAADAAGVPLFINARIDVFLQADPATHGPAQLAVALERARAFADAGADGLFAPLLADEALVEPLCAGTPLPVNLMAMPGLASPTRLGQLGVARISHGPGPYRTVMRALQDAAAAALAD